MSIEDRGLSALASCGRKSQDSSGAVTASESGYGWYALLGMSALGVLGIAATMRRVSERENVARYHEWRREHPEFLPDARVHRKRSAPQVESQRAVEHPDPKIAGNFAPEAAFVASADILLRKSQRYETARDIDKLLRGVKDEATRRRLVAAYLVMESPSPSHPAIDPKSWWQEPLLPSYPKLSPEDAARIATGSVTIKKLFHPLSVVEGYQMVERETHPDDEAPTVAEVKKGWLFDKCRASQGVTGGADFEILKRMSNRAAHSGSEVADWVSGMCEKPNDPRFKALMAEREIALAGGERIKTRYADNLIGIRGEDIPARGASPEKVYENLKERKRLHEEARVLMGKRFARPQSWWPKKPVPGVKFLRTARSVINEGTEMGHCAGTYAADVCEGRTTLASITAPDGTRSTVELVLNDAAEPGESPVEVVQHLGPNNREIDPNSPNGQILVQLLEQIR